VKIRYLSKNKHFYNFKYYFSQNNLKKLKIILVKQLNINII
jgi:hypothetical protein